MNVLHDWDNPYRSGRWCIRRGVQLILYGISKKIPFLRRIPIVEEMYGELYKNAITLAKLDRLANVKGIFGIQDNVVVEFPDIEIKISEHLSEFRRHIHIDLPEKIRLWEPPLECSPRRVIWHYDQRYRDHGENVPILRAGELPIFHVDYPNLLSLYIDWLYWVLIEGGKIYE